MHEPSANTAQGSESITVVLGNADQPPPSAPSRAGSISRWLSRTTSGFVGSTANFFRQSTTEGSSVPFASSPGSTSEMLRNDGPVVLRRLHSSCISNPALEFQTGAAISVAVREAATEQQMILHQQHQQHIAQRQSQLLIDPDFIQSFGGQQDGEQQAHESNADSFQLSSQVEPTPLPAKTIFILCVVVFSEPMCMTILFPFITFMVKGFGITDETTIGYYVGWIASSFSMAQFCTSMFWGWMSDRVGRRPVLLIGLLGNFISILLFGMSKSLLWCIMARSASGFLNGNVGVAKSVLGEITDYTNTARAFSLFGLVWGIGMIMGPVIGGFLSDPVKNMPQIFGNCPFLREYPYFLPCFVSGLISIIGFVVGFFHLEETCPALLARRLQKQSEDSDRGNTLGSQAVEPDILHSRHVTINGNSDTGARLSLILEREEEPQGPRDSIQTLSGPSERASRVEVVTTVSDDESTPLLKKGGEKEKGDACCWGLGYPSTVAVIGYASLSFQNIIFDEVMPLWAVTRPENGGLGYSATQIGMTLSIMGVVTLFVQLVVFPIASRHYDPVTIYRTALPGYIVAFSCFPLISTFISPSPTLQKWTFPVMVCNMALRHVLNVHCFTSVMLLINNSASGGRFGFVNGVGQSAAALVRSIGPAMGGIIWSWSLSNNHGFPFNYYFVFFLLSFFSVLSSILSRLMPDSLRRPQTSNASGIEHEVWG